MRSKKPGVIILSLGIAAGLAALALVTVGVMDFLRSVKSIAVVGAGEQTTVNVEKAGTLVLWADNAGPRAVVPPSLPGHSSDPPTYSLIHVSTGTAASFTPSGWSSMTRSYGSTTSSGLGEFEVSTPGEYTFAADDPSGSIPQFSLTSGPFGATLLKGPILIFGAVLLGLIAFAAIITGTIFIFTGKKRSTPPALTPTS